MISITAAIPASGLRIFVGEPGSEFSECGQVFRARHLGAVQPFDLFAALAQLLDHVVRVATEFPDFVIPIGKAHRDVAGLLRRRERSCPEGPP